MDDKTRELLTDAISMMEYHVEQTRPIHSTTTAIQALRAALAQQAEPSGWRPIETAPKDGTRISLGRVGWPAWNDCKWVKRPRAGERWESFIGAIPFVPTHWQPLPEPPKESSNG